MPLDSYANLQASILSWLARPGDPLVSPSIPDIIELFEREATRRLKVGGAEKRASLTALSAAVALPADFGELRLATSGGVLLTYVTPMQLPDGGGPPAHYTIIGNEMRLGPSPSGGCTVEIVYQSGVPPLSDTNTTNWLLTAHPDCYLFGSLVEAESFIGSDERVPLWAQRREAAFASIETADRKARWGGAPLSIRADGVSGGNGTAAGDWTSAPPVPIPIVSIVAGDGLTGGGTEGIVTVALDTPVTVARGGTGNTSFGVDRVLTGGGPGVQASPATVSSAGDVLAISYTTDGAGDLGGYWWHDDPADPLWWAWYSSADTARLGRWNGTSTFLGDALTVEHATGVVGLPNGATAPTPAPGDNDTSVATTAFVQAALAAGASGINQLTGDVTAGPGSGSQAAAIAANAVTTPKILNANVTYAKIQNVAAARLLGNPTGSAAAPSEISLGTNLSFAGTVLNATSGGSGLSGMTAGQIPIAATATTVTSSGNLSGAVTTSGSLATSLSANAVVTASITNANVTYAKIQNVAANRLLGNATGSAAAPAEIALPLAVANGGTNAAALAVNAGGTYGLTQTLVQTTGTALAPTSGADGTIGSYNNNTLVALGVGASGGLTLGRANGTFASMTAIASGNVVGGIYIEGSIPGAWDAAARALVQCIATETWTSAANGTRWDFSTTLTGGVSTAVRATLAAGLVIGAPTGGDKGVATLNATSVYGAGVLLTSDASLKRDIGELPACLPLVAAIEPKSYRWRAPEDPGTVPPGWADQTHWGFLAQDVEEALAGHEVGVVDVGDDGIRGLSLGDMNALLWKAVQELAAKVAALEAKPAP